ncbi:hypothetical protein SYNPS1DRAFT_22447 [Syncephalis pseudoplumigaleata]|uniref:Uncharacterized protein n=1 Tax=Syncephalis pseudoplumigaleata TaxID=1712513 RepID=A0A4P9Z1K2_9FUNG|nr:hypothetical protein SYNPS1DRAFT_22447 [Syncephalis pseudoplumigaleata]|eukprot:RKP25631.1 hypothetical protein SYNPS1DRAFT_22447 [Syncephalis pseudoplumigaleata]
MALAVDGFTAHNPLSASSSSILASMPADTASISLAPTRPTTKRKAPFSSSASTHSHAVSLLQPWVQTPDVPAAEDANTSLASEMPLRKRCKSTTAVHHRHGSHTTSQAATTTIADLATEILTAIFLHLGQSEDLRACESACRRWRAIVTPILWRAPQIYFTPLLDERTRAGKPSAHTPAAAASTHYSIRVHTRHPLDGDAIPLGLPLATHGRWMRHLDLWPAYSMVRDATILRFTDACTRLRSINLHGCIFVTDTGVGAIAEQCGRSLATINLSYCVRVTDRGLGVIAQHASRSLEQINLKGCALISDYGLQMLSSCGSLRRARLSELPEVTDIGVWALASGCRQLEWIDLTGTCGCSDASAEALSQFCPKLSWLSMARIPSIAPAPASQQRQHPHHQPGTAATADAAATLSDTAGLTFSIRQKSAISRGLTDRGLQALATGCPRLTFLDLSFHHCITDCGVEHLARVSQHLVHVALIGCTRATTRSLYALVKLRHRYGRMACITMGGTPQFDEETLRQETAASPALLRDWKRADAAGYSSRSLPGISWLDTW